MRSNDVARYVVRNPANGIYRYYRRIPAEVAHLDTRGHIKQSLKTRSMKEALERADAVHSALEALWRAMLAGNDNGSALEQYEAAVKAAQSLGFTYRPAEAAAAGDMVEIDKRLSIARDHFGRSTTVVDAVLGLAPDPAPRLSDLWKLYETHNRAGLTGMSPTQMKLHKTSRERAIRYAADLLHDRELAAIDRADVLRFRDWWIDKIAEGGLTAYSANRSFSDIKGMLSVVDDALQTNYRQPWDKIRLKETNATKGKKRLPFAVEWVEKRILAPGALRTMNEDARLIVYAMVETGMRLGEVCNLRPQDIRLDADVPHVEVADREDRRQKTDHSVRQVPLVGVSLWAMRQRPGGFPRYRDKANHASALINKVLDSAGLRPTPQHTVYSLRHTFQDRIENAGASDRMQANLMGHEFGRPTYGDGPEMKRRKDFLEKIKFAWPESA